MTLSISTLAALQKAGSAAFTADVKLKNALKDYAERVNAAIANNPYNLGNDALFANWKVVARLSQTLAGIEEELKKIYLVASDLSLDEQPGEREISALAAPIRAANKRVAKLVDVTPTVVVQRKLKKKSAKPVSRAAAVPAIAVEPGVADQIDLAPTDVKIKPKKKTTASKTKVRSAKVVVVAAKTGELSGNPAKLLQHLERVLNASEFIEISQTAVGREIGVPLGSMTAATKKLTEIGRIVAGPNGGFKLVDSLQAVAA
jgi:hypothetical protein